jgi:hypothetical protein
MLEISEHAKITLERGDEVVPVPSALVPGVVIPRAPSTILFICRDVDKEAVIRVGGVARPTPHGSTGIPGCPGGGKGAAKETVHLLTHHSRGTAVAGPKPEGQGRV